ncbi:hypothetical protein [Kitasatospora sp. NPDC002040]|uniref:hypothetical protein n=1 Tax=Kitasatospora sp. NPDC002040 TaxID=3154661 RepID=UPI0033326C1E
MRTKTPLTYYLATDADGTVPASLPAGTQVNVAEAVGAVVDRCRARLRHENSCPAAGSA